MSTEVIILPEMLAAGMEALHECDERNLEPQELVVAVYLAMRAIEAIYSSQDRGTVH